MTGSTGEQNDTRRQELREFLMAKRAAIVPELAGRNAGSRRRTRGLRREEVAALADVGVTWYTWLEQGRRINVSAQTLERIARALRLSPSDTTYVFSLAGIPRVETLPPPQQRDPRLQAALDGYVIGPAFVVGTFWDVEAYNRLADILFRFDACSGPFPRNHIWRLFMDPQRRSIYADWPAAALLAAGTLRVQYAQHFENSYAQRLVASLKEGSDEFRRLWSQHQTVPFWPVSIGYKLPKYGELQFTSLRFRLMAQEDRFLVLLAPETPNTAAVMTRFGHSQRRASFTRGRRTAATALNPESLTATRPMGNGAAVARRDPRG